MHFSICKLYYTFIHSESKFKNSVHQEFNLSYIRIELRLSLCLLYNRCWWILLLCISTSSNRIYLLGVILDTVSLLMICTSLFLSLLSWQHFHGYNPTVPNCAFRILIPVTIIHDQAVYGLTAHAWCWWLFTAVIILNKTQKTLRQVNHISFNLLSGFWDKTNKCLEVANHLWQQLRCVHWSLKAGSHRQAWAPSYDSWTHAPPLTSSQTCASV